MRMWRGWLLWVTLGGLLAALPGQLAPELRLLADTLRPDAVLDLVALVRGLAAALLLGCALWWWAAATAVVVATTRGRRLRPRGCPRWVHRAVLASVGAAVASGGATAAVAVDGPDVTSSSVDVVHGLPYPDRAEGVTPPSPRHPSPSQVSTGHVPRGQVHHSHVVRPGDTLWALAARDLSPGASAAEITDRWRLIYRLNRAAIGPDPDLIVPGTPLELPAPREESR